MLSLGQQIRELRLKKGLTQIELSQGISTPSLISQIESDRARPSFKTLFAISQRLDVPLDKLLKGVDLGLEHSSKYRMAMAMVQGKEYQSAIPLLEQLLELKNAPVSQVDIQFELATCYLETGSESQALQFFNRVLEWALFQKDHVMMASTMMSLGRVAYKQKELSIALYHTQRALDELGKIEEYDPTIQIHILSQLAAINQEMGKVVEAAKLYEESLSLYEEYSSLQEKGRVYLSLAQAYHMQGEYEKADVYSSKAYSVLSEVKDQDEHNEWQRQLILLRRSGEDWQHSVLELSNLAVLYEHQSDQERAGQIYSDIANICVENGELDEAWEYAEKAHLILPHNHKATGMVHRALAFVFFGRGNQEKGRKHLENAISIFEQQGQLSNLEEVTLHLCHNLSDQGKHDEAFGLLERFHDKMVKMLNERGIVL